MRAEILYFTDPFCSWCWASEPALLALRERYRGQVVIRYVMGGLVKDMSEFVDVANAIRSTADVAPHWQTVSERSGQPIDERLMLDISDPHFSTWPACVAVKAADLQGPAFGERYLRRLRRAALTERAQVQRRELQLELAREVSGLDVDALQQELDGERALQAFRDDLHTCAAFGATGFPTMVFRSTAVGPTDQDEPGVLVGGYRPLATYERILAKVAPGLVRHEPRAVRQLLADYGPLTTRELGEITTLGAGAEEHLRMAVAEGQLSFVDLRGGTLWELPGKPVAL